MDDVFAPAAEPTFLVVDTESVPDGRLLAMTKYPDEALSPEQAVAKAQADARAGSMRGSDFLPVTYQVPIAACVLRVGADLLPRAVECLDAPSSRTRLIAERFWHGVERLGGLARLVTFNGRGFDLPLLRMAAFRYGLKTAAIDHLDLMDCLTNDGDHRLVGGLNLLSKLLGKPGKMQTRGDMVYPLFLAGKTQEINDYCLFDTLDTYFVYLRTRVLTGELTLEREHAVVMEAKEWLGAKRGELPALGTYLANWGDWQPWP
jgi:predicted PolB exonuclease-like 3'-5' exonuclease